MRYATENVSEVGRSVLCLTANCFHEAVSHFERSQKINRFFSSYSISSYLLLKASFKIYGKDFVTSLILG